jgi:hypothetical protein
MILTQANNIHHIYNIFINHLEELCGDILSFENGLFFYFEYYYNFYLDTILFKLLDDDNFIVCFV